MRADPEGEVCVAADLVAAGQRLAVSYDSPVLVMRVESGEDPVRLLAAARESAAVLARGDCHWSAESEGELVVVRQWGFVAEVAAALESFAAELGARGITGRLVVGEGQRPAERSVLEGWVAPLLECHVRTRGKRRVLETGRSVRTAVGEIVRQRLVRWIDELAATEAGIDAALGWLGDAPAGARLWSSLGEHRDLEEARAYVAETFSDYIEPAYRGHAKVWWTTRDAFRLVTCLEVTSRWPQAAPSSIAVGGGTRSATSSASSAGRASGGYTGSLSAAVARS